MIRIRHLRADAVLAPNIAARSEYILALETVEVYMGWFRPRRLQRYTGVRRASLSLISAAALAMAVLAGCSSSNTGAAAPLKMHVHPNGLQLSVSETYQVTIKSTRAARTPKACGPPRISMIFGVTEENLLCHLAAILMPFADTSE